MILLGSGERGSRMKRIEISRYGVLYLTLVFIALVLATILLVKPRLEKHKGWVGIRVHREPASGTLVIDEVIQPSPAYRVGMQVGDRVLSYNGIAVSDVNTLKQLIDDSYINQLVRIILERSGQRLVADTRIGERPGHLTFLPLTITIVQGAAAPHGDRGPCLKCHNIQPPVGK